MSILFKPTRIKNLTLRNRFVRSATYDGCSDRNGGVTEKQIKLFTDLADGAQDVCHDQQDADVADDVVQGVIHAVGPHSWARRSRSALEMTETELKLIAAAAIIGLSSKPVKG